MRLGAKNAAFKARFCPHIKGKHIADIGELCPGKNPSVIMILMRMGDKDENCFIGICGGVEIRFSAALCIIIKQKHLCFGFNGKAAVVQIGYLHCSHSLLSEMSLV